MSRIVLAVISIINYGDTTSRVKVALHGVNADAEVTKLQRRENHQICYDIIRRQPFLNANL